MFDLSDSLYFCRAWEHNFKLIGARTFEISISPLIPGDKADSLFQIHIIVMENGAVTKSRDIFPLDAQQQVLNLELALSNYIKSVFLKLEPVKIWFYPYGNDTFSPDNIPLRFAITIANTSRPTEHTDNQIRNDLEHIICAWLSEGAITRHGGGSSVFPTTPSPAVD